MKVEWKTLKEQFPKENVPLIVTTDRGRVVHPVYLLNNPNNGCHDFFVWNSDYANFEELESTTLDYPVIAWDEAPEPYKY